MSNTTIEVSRELHNKLRREALDLNVKLKDLVEFKLVKSLSKVEINKLRKKIV